MKKKYIYTLIIAVITAIAYSCAILHYVIPSFHDYNAVKSLIMYLGAILVIHLLRMIRVYVFLFGKNISILKNIALYGLSFPMTILFPCYIGDFYKAYLYGYQMESFLNGLLFIVFDRIMDFSVFVLTNILIGWLYGYEIPFSYIFILLLIVMIVSICVLFPDMYYYWKKYFIRYRASKRGNIMLKFLDRLNGTYHELYVQLKGRFVGIVMLSLITWVIEIHVMRWLGIVESYNLHEALNAYAMPEMNTLNFDDRYLQGVGISIMMFGFVTIIMVLHYMIQRGGKHNE